MLDIRLKGPVGETGGPAPRGSMATGGHDVRAVDLVEAEARYARARLSLYRQKRYSGRPTSDTRMRQLELASISADSRLASVRKPS